MTLFGVTVILKLNVYCRPESNDVFDKLLTQYQTRSDNEKVFKSTLVANFECRMCTAIFSKQEFLNSHKCTYLGKQQKRLENRKKKSFINIQPRPSTSNSTLEDLKTTVEIQDSKLISTNVMLKKNSDNSSPRGNNSIG